LFLINTSISAIEMYVICCERPRRKSADLHHRFLAMNVPVGYRSFTIFVVTMSATVSTQPRQFLRGLMFNFAS